MQELDAQELIRKLATAKDIPELVITEDSEESTIDIKEDTRESRRTRLRSGVDILLKGLDFLPLAICQAVAYIGEKSKTINRYLKILRAHDGFTFDSMSDVILQTWISSFKTVRRQSPIASKILHTMAYLDLSGIAEDILIKQPEHCMLFSPCKTFEDGLGVLMAYGLVSRRESPGVPSTRSYILHQYTSLIATKWLASEDPAACQEAFDLALSLVTSCFTPYSTPSFLCQPSSFDTCSGLLPYESSILCERAWLTGTTPSPISEFKRWIMAFESAKLSFLRGNQKVAEERMASCYQYCQDRGGPAERTVQTLIGLGMIKCDKGEYDEVLVHYQEAESVIDDNPTSESCSALRSTVLLNQGKVYRDCGDYVKASILSRMPGRFDEALSLFYSVIETTAERLTKEHRKTLAMRLGRAAALSDEGGLTNPRRAVDELREILDKQVNVLHLPATHVNVIATDHNLAVALGRQLLESRGATSMIGHQASQTTATTRPDGAMTRPNEVLMLIDKVLGLWRDRCERLQSMIQSGSVIKPLDYSDYLNALKTRADILSHQMNGEGALKGYNELLAELARCAGEEARQGNKFPEAQALICKADIYIYDAGDANQARGCLDDE